MKDKIQASVRAAYAAPLINPSEGELGRVRAAFTALADAQWGICNLPSAAGAMAAYAPLYDRLLDAQELLRAGKRGGLHASRYGGAEAEARQTQGAGLLPALLADIEACAAMMDSVAS